MTPNTEHRTQLPAASNQGIALSRRILLLAAGAGAVTAACSRDETPKRQNPATVVPPVGTNPTLYSAVQLAAAIRAKQISPVEALEATLSRLDAVNSKLNAVIWRNDDQARAAARAAADKIMHIDPADLPPFHGVPIPIKDLYAVDGQPVTYGSWAGSDAPSKTNDPTVEVLQRAGFVLTGRTNTPEFGALGATENDRYGITRNPWNLDRTPGGSSGGAAAGMFAIAHGSDGGGSLRQPASYCGLVGLKASRGRVPSRAPGVGFSVSGVVSRNVADTAAVLDLISSADHKSWYSVPPPGRPFLSEVGIDPGRGCASDWSRKRSTDHPPTPNAQQRPGRRRPHSSSWATT